MVKTVKELWAYRQMIVSLVRKDLRGRYKGSVLGFLWTFLNPLLQLAVYTMLFSVILRSGIEKYYLFLFVGLVPWNFFGAALTGGSMAINAQSDMVKKIYFPREVLPVAYVTSCFVNMLLCFVIIIPVVLFSGVQLSWTALIYLPMVMILEYLMAAGVAFLTSAITVYFRDLEHILGIISMAWMYLTPVMYTADMVPAEYLGIYQLNPMLPIIQVYQSVLYYGTKPELGLLVNAFVFSLIVLGIGWLVFSKLKRGFAEEL